MKALPGTLIWLYLLVAVGGCAMASGSSSASRGESAVPAVDARVLPGDRVLLKIWNEPEMSDTFAVANDGTVSLPKLGVIPTDASSVGDFQVTLQDLYGEYLRNPSVEIRVLRRVGISGEVKTPGIYLVDLTMSLPDLISLAGGLTEAGDQNKIVIFRADDVLRFKRSDQERFVSAELLSGDQVVVGTRSFFSRNSWAVLSTGVPLLGYIATVILPALKDL